jgi:allantoate deiminase
MIAGMHDAASVLDRCGLLARCTEEPGRITRRFGTPALAQARDLVADWMRQAGLQPRLDAVGNLIGRRDGPGATLLLGSHLDTVPDGGRYDGALGVLVALAVAARLASHPLPFALEVAAFSDEEGVRFGTTFLGSALLAGCFDPRWLDRRDRAGVTMADALSRIGGDPSGLTVPAREDLLGYLEVHIEQGPVLEDANLPVGVVESIAGQTRARVTFTGAAAHAGTTPMGSRRDALTAAADWIGAVERAGRQTDRLVATVGEIEVTPGAANVVPGTAVVSLDVRHGDDATRTAAVQRLRAEALEGASARGVRVDWDEVAEAAGVSCDARLTEKLAASATAVTGAEVPRLISGAGHDAVMLSAVARVAMLFVRCAGGVSHHPAESVSAQDVAVALDVTTRAVQELALLRPEALP